MGSYSVGEAINMLMEKSGWKPKAHELRLQKEWELIVGRTIAKYTRNVYLNKKQLVIGTDQAALKQELQLGKPQLITRINEYFGESIVNEVTIR